MSFCFLGNPSSKWSTYIVYLFIFFFKSNNKNIFRTTLIPLTPAQIHLIRSLWRQVIFLIKKYKFKNNILKVYLSKGPTVIGSQISHRLFFKEPQIREQFRRVSEHF